MIWSETLWLPHTDSGASQTHTPPHIRNLNTKNKQKKKNWQLLHMKRPPLMCRIPRCIPTVPSTCHLFSRQLQTVALFRSKQSRGPSLGGRKREMGWVESGTEWTSFRSSLTLALVWMVRRFADEERGGGTLRLCLETNASEVKEQSVWGGCEGREEELWHGMARYGVVWFGWLCCRRPSPRPLRLYEDLHERALCSGPAGAPVSEWARAAAALFNGGCLFTPASPVILH